MNPGRSPDQTRTADRIPRLRLQDAHYPLLAAKRANGPAAQILDPGANGRRDRFPQSLEPDIAHQKPPVVTLPLPSVAEWIKDRRRGSLEESSPIHDLQQLKHLVRLQKAVELMDAWEVDIVENEQGPG